MGFRQQRFSEELPQLQFSDPGQGYNYGRLAEDAANQSADRNAQSTRDVTAIRQKGEDALLGGIDKGVDRYQANKQRDVENQRADVQANLAQQANQREQQVADRQTDQYNKYGGRKAEAEIAQSEAGAKAQTAQAQVAQNQAAESQSEREFMDAVDETHPNKVSRRQSSLERRQKKETVDQQIQQAQLELSKTQNVTERQRIGLNIKELELNQKKFAKDSETADLNNLLTRGTLAANKSAAEVANVAAMLRTTGANGIDRLLTADEIKANPQLMNTDPVTLAKATKQAGMDNVQQQLIANALPLNANKMSRAIALQDKAETNANLLAKMRQARNQFKGSFVNNTIDEQAKATFVQAARDLKLDKVADDVETGRIFADLKTGQTISDAMDKTIASQSQLVKGDLARGNADIGDQNIVKSISDLDKDYLSIGNNANPWLDKGTLQGNGIDATKINQKATQQVPTAAPGMKPKSVQGGVK